MSQIQKPVIPTVPPTVFRTKLGSTPFTEALSRGPVVLKKRIDCRKDKDGKPILTPDGLKIPWIDTPKEGGVLVHHETFKYPEKGLRDDFVMSVSQIVKRSLIIWVKIISSKYMILAFLGFAVTPWKYKILIIERWIDEFNGWVGMVEGTVYRYIYHRRLYCPIGRELIKGVETFLKEIGVNDGTAKNFADFSIPLLDHDTAYRYRLEDIFSETTLEKLLQKPRKELKRLAVIFADRESSKQVKDKVVNIAHLLGLLLLLPRIRKAFNKAIRAMKFELLQLDEADREHVRHLSGYKFFGMTQEERIKKWPPEEHTWQRFTINTK